MHELSIVMGIVDLAEKKAREHNATCIERIDLQIGELAGVEWTALNFAWDVAVPNTILEGAEQVIERIPGEATCLECGTAFEVSSLFEPCPQCHQYLTEIRKGKELRIKSLVVH